MPGIFTVKDLELKKKALAAESEVYRETLKLEIRNLGLYARYAKQKFVSPPALQPLLMLFPSLIPSLAAFLIRPRRPKKFRGILATALLGWQMYSRFAPLCSDLFQRRWFRRAKGDERVPAANV